MTDYPATHSDEIAHHWDDYGPPLRPSPEDLHTLCAVLGRWHQENPTPVTHVFLCGVTPELATMTCPFPLRLLGVDRSASMVRTVWPGDLPGVRQAVVGDWRHPPVPPHSQDVVIGDGGFAYFGFPEGQRLLMAALAKTLRPAGLFAFRVFAQPGRRESLAEVWADVHAGRIGSFHAFKWRLAMALQPDSRQGVKQDDVWKAWMLARVDPARLPQPGWSPRAVDMIHFYQGQNTRLYFPTVEEFRALLGEAFRDIEVHFPTYELGERCPIFAARPLGGQ